MKSSFIIHCAFLFFAAVAQAGGPAKKLISAPVVEGEDEKRAEDQLEKKSAAIPESYSAENKVAIKLEHLKRDANGWYVATFRIINPGNDKISYYAYPGGSPKTDTQILRDGKWGYPDWRAMINARFREFSIEPGQSLVFSEQVRGTVLPARIGISCWRAADEARKRFTIWSDPIER